MKTVTFPLIIFTLLCGFVRVEARIIRVDANSTAPGPNGENWVYAYPSLDWALREADPDDEIWVTENGEHIPSDRTNPNEPRSATFLLPRAIKLYGGFRGDEESLEERDPVLHKSTLSGNLGDPGDDSDDAFHVITASAIEAGVLDGFIITRGAADGMASDTDARGGGIYMEQGDLSIRNCVFIYNTSRLAGSALWASRSRLVIDDCDIRYNHSQGIGGAFYFESSHVDIASDLNSNGPPATRFTGNSARGAGGAVFAVGCEILSFFRCRFVDNFLLQSTGQGGAISVIGDPDHESSLKMLAGWMQDNSAHEGGAVYIGGVLADVTGCAFLGNTSTGEGGAIRVAGNSRISLNHSDLSQNHSGGNGGALFIDGSAAYLSRVDFYDNSADGGGGAMAVKDSDRFYSYGGIVGENHSSGDGGGAFHFGNVALIDIDYALLRRNYIDHDRWAGGAILIVDDQGITEATLTGCRALGNHTWYGGVVASLGAEVLTLNGCDFFDNMAVPNDGIALGGGAVWATGHYLNVYDGEFSSNQARGGRGGAIHSACQTLSAIGAGFSRNIAGEGGAVSDTPFASTNPPSQSVFKQSKFQGNEATRHGGAVFLSDRVKFEQCVLADNTAAVTGSALYATQSETVLSSCVVTANLNASAVLSTSGNSNVGVTAPFLKIVNSTVAANASTGVAADNGTLEIHNAIVIENGPPETTVDLSVGAGVTTYFSYSMLGGAWNGSHLLPESAVFRDLDHPNGADGIYATVDDGLALKFNSAAVNAGDNQRAAPKQDVLDKQRIRDGTVDLGAYELTFIDNDLDGFSDAAELIAATRTDDAASHPPLFPVIDLARRSLLFFPKMGQNYQIEHSQDLRSWAPFGDPVSWEDAVVILPLPWSGSGLLLPQDFFRVIPLGP
jgi:predicted outer membrane repeat protein